MNELEAIGAKCVTTEIDRRSTNPDKRFYVDMPLCKSYKERKTRCGFVLYNQAPMFMEGWFADYMVYLKL